MGPDQTKERRADSRHSVKLSVQLIRSDTIPLQLRAVELSMGGMHIECDQAKAQLLAPPGVGEGRRFTTRVLLSNPDSKRRALTLSAIVKSVIETGKDHYRVSLHFVRFFGKSHNLLENYIAELSA